MIDKVKVKLLSRTFTVRLKKRKKQVYRKGDVLEVSKETYEAHSRRFELVDGSAKATKREAVPANQKVDPEAEAEKQPESKADSDNKSE